MSTAIRSANYSIKGYLYQFCVTIEQVLQLKPMEKIIIEGVEDIDAQLSTGLNLFQCKYHEQLTFSPSKVYKPIGQMISHYLENEQASISYRLYAYFESNAQPENNWITLDFLKKSLRKINSTLTATDRQLASFLRNFKFCAGHKFEDLIEKIKLNLCSIFSCEQEEVEYYYNNAIAYTAQIATKKTESERTVTKETFKDKIDKKINLFDIWQKKYIGKKAYIRNIKTRLKNENALLNTKIRYLFIDSSLIKINQRVPSIQSFLKDLAEQYSLTGKLYDTKPWTVIIDISEQELKKIKAYLIKNKIYYNDGYEDISFCKDYFNSMPIINTYGKSNKISKASHSIKIISAMTFKELSEEIIKENNYPHVFLDISKKENNRVFLNDNTTLYVLSAIENFSELSEILKK